MSGRFSSYIMNKPKRSTSNNNEGRGRPKSSTNASTASTYSNLNSLMTSVSASSSRGRTSRPSPGPVPKTPTKSPIRTPVTYSKKVSSTAQRSRQPSPAVQSSTSDDLSRAIVLRKKSSARSPAPAVERKQTQIINPSTRDDEYYEINEVGSKRPKVAIRNHIVASSLPPIPPTPTSMQCEGPMEIPKEDFDFYSILARPKVWNVEEDEEYTQIGINEFTIPATTVPPKKEDYVFQELVHSSQACNVIKKESEIWGSMRTSTAETESSSPPSLTSLTTEADKKEEDVKKMPDEDTLARDENNNVLTTIKNTIYSSLTFFEVSRPSPISTTTTISVDEMHGGNEGQRKEGTVLGNKNQESSAGENNSNSNSPTLLRDISHTVLIPLEIKEQLRQTYPGNNNDPGSVEPLQDLTPCLQPNSMRNGTEFSPEVQELPPLISKEQQLQEEEMKKIIPSFAVALNELKKNEAGDEPGTSEFEDSETEDIKGLSYTSSYTSAVAEEEFFGVDEAIQNIEELDTQETQTQGVTALDAETVTENTEKDDKMKKLKSFVISLNTGVDIDPPPPPPPEDKKRSKPRKPRGIMKTSPQDSVNIEGTPPAAVRSLSTLTDQRVRRRPIPEKIKYPQTFTQVGADYGFPADITLSKILGIATMAWPSSDKEDDEVEEKEPEKKEAETTSEGGEGSRIVETAYELFNAGINFACNLIRIESELEPREDWIRYNGYKIRVCGKKLLLESLHVNCDYSVDAKGIWYRSNHSFISLRPPSFSRSELEQSCEGRRVRIVVRVAGPPPLEAEEGNPATEPAALEHSVRLSDGKWTCTFGNGEESVDYVEIVCPTGVHPESLAYGLISGILLVDAP